MTTYEHCKTFGHSWEMIPRPPTYRGKHSRVLFLGCTRCPMVRHDIIDALGQVMRRFYDRPADYSEPKEVRPTRSQLRARAYKRRPRSS